MIDNKILKDNLSLYLVTDRGMMLDRDLNSAVESAVRGGVSIVQLREKNASFEQFLERGVQLKRILDKHNVPLIINDNIEVCIALDAYGVHLGQSDGGIAEARALLGSDKVIGASARTVEGAMLAVAEGADYLGIGAVFGTSTKLDACTINPDILGEIASSVDVPIVAIGGVCENNILQLNGKGISGVAVISDILKSDDIESKSKRLRGLVDKVVVK